jgi:hypothetical protein
MGSIDKRHLSGLTARQYSAQDKNQVFFEGLALR